ncbi:MAG: NAD(P)-dependent oxidoreductase [Chloroflexi bacterium]|nr:NAD(P)-dependent oxidoreductase [Chloroflexota bacterium]
MSKRKVIVTGAAGYIFSRMLDAFRDRYELTLLDATQRRRDGTEIPDIEIVDLTDRNRDVYRAYFRGADAVLHCAFIGAMGSVLAVADTAGARSQKFQNEMLNLQMAYNVYQVSVEEDVRRVIVCSSNHAADYYERLIWANQWDFVDPSMKTYSDNYYGWAKEAYEDLGFVFATGVENGAKRLENVQLRIGGPRETDVDQCDASDLKKLHRALGAYLSQRDQIQLAVKSIEAADIRDEYGVPFQIFYGISDNDHKFWSITNARNVIGYAPEDNSAVKFADTIARIMQEAQRMQYPRSLPMQAH